MPSPIPSPIKDLKAGLCAGWPPLLTLGLITAFWTAIDLWLNPHLVANVTREIGGPTGIFLWALGLSLAYLVALFAIWCWFLSRWLQAEFGLADTMSPGTFLRHIALQQFLALLIATILMIGLGLMIIMIFVTAAVEPLLDVLIKEPMQPRSMLHASAILTGLMLFFLTPVFLLSAYVYVRFSACLGLMARTGKAVGIGRAFALCETHAPDGGIFRTAWKMVFYTLVLPTLLMLASLMLATDWITAMIPVPGNPVALTAGEAHTTLTIINLLISTLWTVAIPLIIAFFLIRFLRRIDSALPDPG